jgi:hypothetical protein
VTAAAVIIGTVDPATADEALRAAVGLTLRGARVQVVLTDPSLTPGPRGERALATLQMFGHHVDGPAALPAALDHATVEIWGPVPATTTTDHPRVHLVRPGRRAAVVAPGDTVLDLPDHLDDAAADHLLDLLDRAIVW